MTQLFRSYLFAYLVVLGIGLGSLGFLLLHSLVGGAWGKASRGVLQACADTLPWLGGLFIPILVGLKSIYPWTDAAHLISESASASHKHVYFMIPFFVLRAVAYFSTWIWLARREKRQAGGAGWGLLLFVLTASFASFDWIMSLEPHWSSSIYGAMLIVGNGLSTLAFTVLVLAWGVPKATAITEDTAHDLGNLMLAFVMLWAYMGLSQYLIIWSANLPEEIGWYLARQKGGWQVVAILLILFQFTLPFLLLLARKRKRKLQSLARVAALILALRVVDLFWLTVPDFSPGRFSLHVLDAVALAALGYGWLFLFKRTHQKGGFA